MSLERLLAQRRQKMWNSLEGDVEVIVLVTNARFTKTNDLEHPFRPHSNMLYLSGHGEPEILVLLFKNEASPRVISDNFRDALRELKSKRVAYSYDANTFHPSKDASHAAVHSLIQSDPSWNDCTDAIFRLRVRKNEAEVAKMRVACRATAAAMKTVQAMSTMTPRLSEKELAAWVNVVFAQERVECCAFRSIVAVDGHAADWHHEPTHTRVGWRLLVDIGAHQEHYAADMSRTWKTGDEPDEMFEWMITTVRLAHDVALRFCVPGQTQLAVEKAAQEVLEAECAARNIFGPEARCPHLVTHWVGLDVHDVGDREIPFEPNMTLAVEPALYIEKRGVRWENTVRITETSECEILTVE